MPFSGSRALDQERRGQNPSSRQQAILSGFPSICRRRVLSLQLVRLGGHLVGIDHRFHDSGARRVERRSDCGADLLDRIASIAVRATGLGEGNEVDWRERTTVFGITDLLLRRTAGSVGDKDAACSGCGLARTP
jgi:hypothetical protein